MTDHMTNHHRSMSSHTTRRATATYTAEGDVPMAATTAWTSDELSNIGAAEELQLAPLQQDGSLRKPVTIWVVRHGDDLFVRSVNGRTATWFRGAQLRHEAHTLAASKKTCSSWR